MRLPTQLELVMAIKEYASGSKGLVLYHDSFYDYQYDTKLNNYHAVDSIVTIGNITDVERKDGKVFIILDCNDEKPLDPSERYICFYRSVMESGLRSRSRRLKFTNLFAIDIIHIEEDEVTERMELSTVEAVNS